MKACPYPALAFLPTVIFNPLGGPKVMHKRHRELYLSLAVCLFLLKYHVERQLVYQIFPLDNSVMGSQANQLPLSCRIKTEILADSSCSSCFVAIFMGLGLQHDR